MTPVKKLVDASVATEQLTPSSQSNSTPSTSNSSNRSAGQLGARFANQLLHRGRNPIVTVRADGSVVEINGTARSAGQKGLEAISATPTPLFRPEDISSRPSSSQFRENSKILVVNEFSIPSSAPPTSDEDIEDDQEMETISASVTKSEEESTLNQVSPIPSENVD
uniref:SEP domain-containing protein n=1 Tax=Steinernema glaseri TaxID=37863 RepID=A0A1I7ZU99_9BILA